MFFLFVCVCVCSCFFCAKLVGMVWNVMRENSEWLGAVKKMQEEQSSK